MSILSHAQWRRMFGQDQQAVAENSLYLQNDEWFSLQPQNPLIPNAASWTTEACGIDVVLRNAAKSIEPLWTDEPSDIPLTHENLKGAAYDPYFPLVRGSACTHSLSTPSIGTVTTEEGITATPPDRFLEFKTTKQALESVAPGAPAQSVVPPPHPPAHPAVSTQAQGSITDAKPEPDFIPYKLFAPNPLTQAVDAWFKDAQAKESLPQSLYPTSPADGWLRHHYDAPELNTKAGPERF